jgi:hypothetical protein
VGLKIEVCNALWVELSSAGKIVKRSQIVKRTRKVGRATARELRVG